MTRGSHHFTLPSLHKRCAPSTRAHIILLQFSSTSFFCPSKLKSSALLIRTGNYSPVSSYIWVCVYVFHNEWAPSALSSVLYGTRWPAAAVQQCRHFLKRPKESISFQISPVSYYLPVFSMCLCVLAYWPIGNWLQLEIAEYTHKQDREKRR